MTEYNAQTAVEVAARMFPPKDVWSDAQKDAFFDAANDIKAWLDEQDAVDERPGLTPHGVILDEVSQFTPLPPAPPAAGASTVRVSKKPRPSDALYCVELIEDADTSQRLSPVWKVTIYDSGATMKVLSVNDRLPWSEAENIGSLNAVRVSTAERTKLLEAAKEAARTPQGEKNRIDSTSLSALQPSRLSLSEAGYTAIGHAEKLSADQFNPALTAKLIGRDRLARGDRA